MEFLSKVARRHGAGDHIYVVGGAVRDFVIDRPIKDVDVVVDTIGLGRDSAWFAKEVAKAIPVPTDVTTNQYGVAIVTIKGNWQYDGTDLKGEVIEIANARKESYGGDEGKGYKPHQVGPATIEEDIYRREFTFNTLLWRLSDLARGPEKAEILDLTGCGMKDLEEGFLRCPSSPDKTFSDDPTRLLRVIKFVARYGLTIPPDVEASIKRNARRMKQAPWEAIGTLFVENVLKQSTAPDALRLMKRLGLLDVVAEMVQEQKPFAAYLAGHLKDRNVSLMLDLMDLGLSDPSPLSFLSKPQQQRFREVTTGMPEDEAREYLRVLQKPSLDNMALIEEFAIPKNQRRSLRTFAREALLEDPTLTSDARGLQQAVQRRLRRHFR